MWHIRLLPDRIVQAEAALSAFAICKRIQHRCAWQEGRADQQLSRAADVIKVVGVAWDRYGPEEVVRRLYVVPVARGTGLSPGSQNND